MAQALVLAVLAFGVRFDVDESADGDDNSAPSLVSSSGRLSKEDCFGSVQRRFLAEQIAGSRPRLLAGEIT